MRAELEGLQNILQSRKKWRVWDNFWKLMGYLREERWASCSWSGGAERRLSPVVVGYKSKEGKKSNSRRWKNSHVWSANLRHGVLLWASHLRSDFPHVQCVHLKPHLSNAFIRVVRVQTFVSGAFSEDRDREGGNEKGERRAVVNLWKVLCSARMLLKWTVEWMWSWQSKERVEQHGCVTL